MRASQISFTHHSATSKARATATLGSPGASLSSGRHEAAAGARAAAAAAASPGTTIASASAAAAAAIRGATRAHSGLVTSTERLDTKPANDYDVADALSAMSMEQTKCMLLHTQDLPTGAHALRQANGPCDWGIGVYGASRNSASTPMGALGLKFAVASSLLVLARPAGTDPYSSEEQIQRAATIASGPDGFKALWKELEVSASAQAQQGGTCDADDAEPEDDDDGKQAGHGSSIDDLAKKATYFANRGEWKKAYACLVPTVHADATDKAVQQQFVDLTPQAQPPRPEKTADEPGVAPQELDRVVFNSVHKSLPRARSGGPLPLGYETVTAIASGPARDSWHNACNSFVRGEIHQKTPSICAATSTASCSGKTTCASHCGPSCAVTSS